MYHQNTVITNKQKNLRILLSQNQCFMEVKITSTSNFNTGYKSLISNYKELIIKEILLIYTFTET